MTMKLKLENDQSVFGAFVQTGSNEAVELIGWSGYDFVIIDMEHGAIDENLSKQLIRTGDAANIECLVRIPSIDVQLIGRLLDAGAKGIVAPNVNSAAEAEKVVSATRYSPDGSRGACPLVRSVGYSVSDWARDWPRIVASKNAEVNVWLIIETRQGVENFGEIATVTGVDAISVGRFDLAQDMGFGGDVDDEELDQVVKEVTESAHAHGINTMKLSFRPEAEDVERVVIDGKESGSRIFAIGADRQIWSNAFEKIRSVL